MNEEFIDEFEDFDNSEQCLYDTAAEVVFVDHGHGTALHWDSDVGGMTIRTGRHDGIPMAHRVPTVGDVCLLYGVLVC